MQQTESITIDRPPVEVWALVGDVRNWTKWLKDISDVETSHMFTSVAIQLNRSPNGGGGVP